METAIFTETEINYMLDKLFKYALFDEDVARVCRLLTLQFTNRFIEGKLEKIEEGSHDKKRIQRIFKNKKVEGLQK